MYFINLFIMLNSDTHKILKESYSEAHTSLATVVSHNDHCFSCGFPTAIC